MVERRTTSRSALDGVPELVSVCGFPEVYPVDTSILQYDIPVSPLVSYLTERCR
jgi:hypothetical protein